MAYIKCPHCQKPVDDAADKCTNCGIEITAAEKERAAGVAVEFIDFRIPERQKLWDEFHLSYPKQNDNAEKEETLNLVLRFAKIFVILGAVVFGVCFIVDLITFFAKGFISVFWTYIGDPALCLLIIGAFMYIARPFYRKSKAKSLTALKMFQKWLKDHKGIEYSVVFSGSDKNWQKYFDNIDLEKVGYIG